MPKESPRSAVFAQALQARCRLGGRMIIKASAAGTDPSVPAWHATRGTAAALLDAVPRAQLDIEALTALHRLVVPVTNPYRGQIRDQPAFICLNGVVQHQLPAAAIARAMVAEALHQLEAAVLTGAAGVSPITTASEIAYRVMQAHPFLDGNGRVARAVAHWVLRRAGHRVVDDPRGYCRERKADYYEALAIRSGMPPHTCDRGPWDVFYAGLVTQCYSSPLGWSTTHQATT